VTSDLRKRDIQAVVVDIEGTTTPISFVHDVLFPWARSELRSYLRENLDAIHLHEPLRQLREEWSRDLARGAAPPPWHDENHEQRIASIAAYAEWLMDRDRKVPGLKALQGHIWRRGYENGALRGQVFPDVQAAFARWKTAGMSIAIFSSGSVLAQQMLFRTSTLGDLTPCIDAFFDTSVGPKTSPDSYRRIADALRCPAGRVLFISDATLELEAAREAGFVVMMCIRPSQSLHPHAAVALDIPRCAPSGDDWVSIGDFGETD
jgi:enolase-phosphatase E1